MTTGRLDEGTNVEARRAALHALEPAAGVVPDPAALARAVEAFLRDPDWRVRKDAAAFAARHLESDEMAMRLSRGVLQGDDVGLRNAAIEALATGGTTEPRQHRIHHALAALEAEASHTALKFLCAAWVGGGTLALGHLSRHAEDPDSTTATAALEALARIGGHGAEQALTQVLLGSRDDVVRLAALEGLVAARARLTAGQLAPLLADPLLLRPTLRALGHTADRGAVAPLIEHLGHKRHGVAATAALAQLAEHGELQQIVAAALSELAAPLREKLLGVAQRHGERDDAEPAHDALVLLLLARDVRALSPVAALAAHREPGRTLLEALRRFGGDAVPGLVAAVPSLDPPGAAWALEAAVELAAASGAPPVVAQVRTALRAALESGPGARPSELVEIAALRGLSRFGEAQDAARVVERGARGSSPVATAASQAIEALATAAPRAIETALEGHETPLTWSKAVRALPRALALEKLGEAAASADPAARKVAVEGLAHIGGAEAADLAAIAVADEDESVRIAAVKTLAELASQRSRPSSPPPPGALAALGVALRSPEAALRAAAIRASAEHALPLDADALALAADPSPEVLAALLRAVSQPGAIGDDTRAAILAATERATAHEDDEVVKAALAAMAHLDAPGLAAAMIAALDHRAWDVRLDVARWMAGELSRGGGAEPLRRALAARRAAESDDLVRAAIDAALSGWGTTP